jgi:hypothetical protein
MSDDVLYMSTSALVKIQLRPDKKKIFERAALPFQLMIIKLLAKLKTVCHFQYNITCHFARVDFKSNLGRILGCKNSGFRQAEPKVWPRAWVGVL